MRLESREAFTQTTWTRKEINHLDFIHVSGQKACDGLMYAGDMTDVVDTKTRSRIMSRIGGKDTRPEMLTRQGLHRLGFRYSLHDRKLPGRPDLVLKKYRAAVFVHGCFWHRHDGCRYATPPGARAAFWLQTLPGSAVRDRSTQSGLRALGWRVLLIWDCALKKDPTLAAATLAAGLKDPTAEFVEVGARDLTE